MKRYLLFSILVFVCISTNVPGLESDMRTPPEPGPEQQMERRLVELELQEREAELDFQQQMRKLELEQRKMELERQQKNHEDGGAAVILLLCLVVNILAAIWVYQDFRKHNTESGIWIAITLLAGLFGALVYSIVRLKENKKPKT
jgi:hypothetical protein